MSTEAEKKLWNSFRQGNKDALKSIYNTFADVLFNYGTKFSADTDLVQDEIHDLFIYLFEKGKSLSVEVSLRPYLMVSLRRRILLRLKETNLMNNDGEKEKFSLDLSFEEKLINAEIQEEIKSSLKNALNNLTSREKEIIYLKYFENLNSVEISNIMQINNQATRNLLSKTLGKLRTMVSNTHLLSSVLLSF